MSELVIALDLPTLDENYKLFGKLDGLPVIYKINALGILQGGRDFIQLISQANKLILDAKLHDIPNTMKFAAIEAAKLGAFGLTVHSSAGAEAVKLTTDSFKEYGGQITFAVTVLTSSPNHDLNINQAVVSRGLSMNGKSDGLVCGVHEVNLIKSHLPLVPVLVPGIRDKMGMDDQSRCGTLEQACKAGSDYIVMGRPIYLSDNPVEKVKEILHYLGK